MHTIRTLVLAAFAATALGACMPDTPETQLTWDANTRMTKGQERAYSEPTRTQTRTYAASGTSAPKTYVYQDAYASKAPAPLSNHGSATPAYAQDGYGSTANGTGGYGKSSYSNNATVSRQALAPLSADTPRFDWPLNGRVISSFGTTSSGGKNDGINIAAPLGAPIHASAAGTVTYSGNELRGYGNLVLLKHPGNFTTAYANADRIVVNKGELVSRGQIIGYTGQSGDVTSPQLHFEIRRDVTPIDPRSMLSSSTASNN